MKKKIGLFVIGDTVRCGDWVGTLEEINNVFGKVVYKVVNLDGKTIRFFNPGEIQRVEIDADYESNRYLAEILKQGTEKQDNSKVMENMSVDELLDTYNSNKKLYELTGEEDFKAGMDEVMGRLKEHAKGK